MNLVNCRDIRRSSVDSNLSAREEIAQRIGHCFQEIDEQLNNEYHVAVSCYKRILWQTINQFNRTRKES